MIHLQQNAASAVETLQGQFFMCVSCKETKSVSEFSKDRSRKSGIQNKCKACYSQYQRKWSKENRNTHNSVRNKWRQKNIDKWRSYLNKWRRDNSDLNASYVAARRASSIKATPLWADRQRIKSIYAKAKELTLLTGIKHSVDHIVPLQGRDVCGLHVEYNLQILTSSENSRKHRRYEREHVCPS